jgi:hypothetical protein
MILYKLGLDWSNLKLLKCFEKKATSCIAGHLNQNATVDFRCKMEASMSILGVRFLFQRIESKYVKAELICTAPYGT